MNQKAESSDTEKKWFIHSGKQQEGPLALEEVRRRLGAGELQQDHHIWCKGMESWKKIREVEAVQERSEVPAPADLPPPMVGASPARTGHTKTDIVSPNEYYQPQAQHHAQPQHPQSSGTRSGVGGSDDISVLMEMKPGIVNDDSTKNLDISRLRAAEKEAAKALKVAAEARKAFEVKSASEEGSRGAKAAMWIVLVAALGVGGYLAKSFMSSIPGLEHLSKEEASELQDAVKADPKAAGVKVAIGLSNETPETPVFYVASNLPDGANVDIYLTSVTSGDPSKADAQFSATLAKSFAKVQSTSRLPDGEYVVTVAEGAAEPDPVKAALQAAPPSAESPAYIPKDRKILASKHYMLGAKKEGTQ